MELWHHSHTPGFSYARTVYYYASPGLRDGRYRLKPDDVLYEPNQPIGWQPQGPGGGDESRAVFYQAEQALQEPAAAGVQIQNGGIIPGEIRWNSGLAVFAAG
jgi:hypothetical protein